MKYLCRLTEYLLVGLFLNDLRNISTMTESCVQMGICRFVWIAYLYTKAAVFKKKCHIRSSMSVHNIPAVVNPECLRLAIRQLDQLVADHSRRFTVAGHSE